MRLLGRVTGALLLAAAIGWVFAPALSLELTGDDFQMVQVATEITRTPSRLFSPIGEFFRPAGLWTLAVDRLVWGTDPRGYHLTTLMLHLLAALLLVASARKLGLPRIASWLVGAIWACSPFASEVAVWAAVRHEQILFIGWLVLILAWPVADEKWTRARAATAIAAVALTVLSKETWVVTPGLVALLALVVQRAPLRRALVLAGLTSLGVLAYASARFLVFPSFGGYYEFSLASLSKLPQMLGAFLCFEPLQPFPEAVSWRGLLAIAVTLAIIVMAFRRNPATTSIGTGLLLMPLLPVLPVPYLPARYTHIPYAGFLLLVAGAIVGAAAELPRRLRRPSAMVAMLGLALLITWEVTLTRATLADWSRVSAAHRRLLDEARAFVPSIPLGFPLVVVRQEDDNPLLIVARSPRGMPQLWFPRHDDPDGLVDTAALFEWCLGRRGFLVKRIDGWEHDLAGIPGGVIAHTRDFFAWSERSVPDITVAARRWRDAGLHIRVIELERADAPGRP